MTWFDWTRIDDFGRSEPSRRANILRLWTRTTIPWSLQCEENLSRADAFEIVSMQFETLGFVDNFWLLGVVILTLTLMPHVAYLRMTEPERKESLYLRFEPIGSRLVFLLIFNWLSSMSQRERDLCADNIDAVSNLSRTNPCTDKYSQVDTKYITGHLSSAQSTLDRYNLMYWLLYLLALGELFALSYLVWRDWPKRTSVER